MMHIAAAFNKQIISIWGNTIPAFGMSPFTDIKNYKTAEVLGLGCRPCSHLGYDECPKGHFDCMNKQDTSLIASWIND
jgi:ADP-heptose:LPS heptosyltransferase